MVVLSLPLGGETQESTVMLSKQKVKPINHWVIIIISQRKFKCVIITFVVADEQIFDTVLSLQFESFVPQIEWRYH